MAWSQAPAAFSNLRLRLSRKCTAWLVGGKAETTPGPAESNPAQSAAYRHRIVHFEHSHSANARGEMLLRSTPALKRRLCQILVCACVITEEPIQRLQSPSGCCEAASQGSFQGDVSFKYRR